MKAAFAALSIFLCLAALAPRAVLGDCYYARPYAKCVADAHLPMQNWTTMLLMPRKPQLMTAVPLYASLGARGQINLLEVLPVNEMAKLIKDTVPARWHDYCYLPMMRHAEIAKIAANRRHRYYKTFQACTDAPVPSTKDPAVNNVLSYVYSAFGDLSNIPRAELAKLPLLKRLRERYLALGPRLSVCIAIQPCTQNLFMGIRNLRQFLRFKVNCGWGEVNFQMRLKSWFYSTWVMEHPPAWSNTNTVQVWHQEVINPRVAEDIGRFEWVDKVAATIPRGSTYVAGALAAGWGKNTIQMRDVYIDLGQQSNAWALVRDFTHRALSMGLTTLPDVTLWNKIRLPFRSVAEDLPGLRFRRVQLTSRASDCHFWLTAPSGEQRGDPGLFARHMGLLGKLLERLFVNAAKEGTGRVVTGLHMHGSGSAVALRLEMGVKAGRKDTFALTPAAAKVAGLSSLVGPFAVIFTAFLGEGSFHNAVSLDYKDSGVQLPPWRRAIHFCSGDSQCPQGLFFEEMDPVNPGGYVYYCGTKKDAKMRVCIPEPAARGAAAGAAAAAAAAAGGPPPPQGPSPPKEEHAPLDGSGITAAAEGVEHWVGAPCEDGVLNGSPSCPWPLNCILDYEADEWACHEVG